MNKDLNPMREAFEDRNYGYEFTSDEARRGAFNNFSAGWDARANHIGEATKMVVTPEMIERARFARGKNNPMKRGDIEAALKAALEGL